MYGFLYNVCTFTRTERSRSSDVNTFGFRLEFRKVLFKDHVLTYGIDYFNDNSFNTDLKAETSLNFDVGLRYRLKGFYLESSYFWNTIYNGIRVASTGEEINGLPEYQNINVDKLRIQGVEILGQLSFKFGLSLTANFTRITSKDIGNPDIPYTDTFSSKLNFNARWDDPRGLFWLGYNLRHHGDQKDVVLVDNPIGDIIPGFTVHNASLGINLLRKSSTPIRLGIVIVNLTNALYSEFANASFFRPAPRRHIVLTWSMDF